ncbi:hypothetical protein PKB_3162 [Pseudomonas knackmussii B13]|uniref:Uncharacterized protein n=1 Tax=Pseudomonas knackmussii (strain DSM 6978 / CCUG 54928 / LMG 23759 / B13) TaxID=1301098 RepID=A0A024HIQ8_PSEKB|nr:hypothetical protein PKB_3162 [Pseudomonas knackmussii B13]
MAANRAHGALLKVDIGVVFSRMRSAPTGHKKGGREGPRNSRDRPSDQLRTASSRVATPWPPPMHWVAMA